MVRGVSPPAATARQREVLAIYVAAGGSVSDAADLAGIRPSTVKRHMADLRARTGLSTEQLAEGAAQGTWLADEMRRSVVLISREAAAGVSPGRQ